MTASPGGPSESHEAGVDVPGRLSVAGFDDSELSEFVHPALTTVRADPFAFGEAAARTLNLLIDGEGPVADVELPPARLVVRRSTTAPASQ